MEKKTIGAFLAALRKEKGMTQQEVADRLNVSNKTVSKWERDESYPEITLIPVLAEFFEVTADEILKGERIPEYDTVVEKTAAKVDKQNKQIFNSSITRFKNVSYIALALVLAGMVCLFTIAYAAYRPVIAFGVFLLFTLASVTLELIQINLTNTALKVNDILKNTDEVVSQVQLKKYRYAFAVFYANTAAVVFALPFILVRDASYVHSVISMAYYVSLIPALIVISLIIFLIAFSVFREKISLPADDISAGVFSRKKMTILNVIQGSLAVAALLFVMIGVLNFRWKSDLADYLSKGFFLIAVAGMILCVVVLAVGSKKQGERLALLAAGVRNLVYGFAGMLAISGITYWQVRGGAEGFVYNFAQLTRASWIILAATGAYALVYYLRIKK